MRLFLLCLVAVGLGYAQRIDGSFERTLNVSGPVDLELVTDAGGIYVVPGPPGAVHIRGILRAQDSWLRHEEIMGRIHELEAHPPIEQTESSIRVAVHDRSLLRGVSMRLEVEVPHDSRLRARADSGGIGVRGIKGPVDCRTDSGGIRASEIGAEVRAAADSGGIHIRGVNGPVYARGDSGGIEAFDIAGNIDAGVDSGGIRVSQTSPGMIKTHTDSGGVDIALVKSAGYDIKAHAGSGRITADNVAVSGNFSRHEINGRLRGGGPLVDAKSDSGNIQIH